MNDDVKALRGPDGVDARNLIFRNGDGLVRRQMAAALGPELLEKDLRQRARQQPADICNGKD